MGLYVFDCLFLFHAELDSFWYLGMLTLEFDYIFICLFISIRDLVCDLILCYLFYAILYSKSLIISLISLMRVEKPTDVRFSKVEGVES